MSSAPPPPKDRSKGRSPALELLDEYWFFSNTLANSNTKDREDSKGSCSAEPSRLYASWGRRLLRTPSLPSPSKLSKDDDDLVPVAERRHEDDAAGSGNRQQQQEEHEVEEDDLNWSSIYEGVLRTRMAEASSSSRSALRRAPSMPVPSSSATGQSKPTPTSTTRRRPSPRSMSASQQPVLARSKSGVFRADDKKWRSSGDLESVEVQGFRDLGFVFDKEDLRESLAGVLPGLKQQAAGKTGRSRSSGRPYLSEAWQRPPALVRVQSEARSAAEVKDQLRMWAQAVACNVRQEC